MTNEHGHHIPAYPIAGVTRTLRTLEVLAASGSVSVAELRAALDVGASTAHRLLSMLVFHGYAVRTDRRYARGPALAALARSTGFGRDTPESVRIAMATIAERCGETVHAGTLIGTDILYTHAIDSPAVLRVTTRAESVSPRMALRWAGRYSRRRTPTTSMSCIQNATYRSCRAECGTPATSSAGPSARSAHAGGRRITVMWKRG